MALIGFLLTLLAWFRPVGESEEIEQERKGIDIVVALDVSDSMRARDVKPDRMTRAKRELDELLERIRGDRIALVAFSGVAFLETPLTLDYGTFSLFLKDIQAGFIPVKGTNIEAALLKSLEALSVKDKDKQSASISNRGRAILLITDGEDFEGDWSKIRTRAKDSQTSIFIIGVGTDKGGTIPLSRGVKKDRSGQPVVTKLNRAALKKMAKETGGKYVDVSSSDLDSYQIYDLGLKTLLDENEYEKQKYVRKAELYQLPLLLSILVLALSRLKYLGIFLALAFFPIFTAREIKAEETTYKEAITAYDKGNYESAASILNQIHQTEQPDFKSRIAQGATDYRLGNFEQASENFSHAFSLAGNNKEKAQALYNSGNSLVQLEKYEDAIKIYKQTLELNPDDEELKSNLEYAKKLLKQQKNDQQQQGEQDKNKQDSDSKNQNSEQKNSENNESEENKKNEQDESQDQQQSSQQKPEEKNDEEDNESSEGDESQEEEKQDSSEQQEEQDSEEKEEQSGEQQQASPATETEGEGEKQEQQSILNRMLSGIEENTSASRQHKTRKALKELKRENLKPPEKDW